MARKPINNDILDDEDGDIVEMDDSGQQGTASTGRSSNNNMAARRQLEIRREERELNKYLYDLFD